MPAADLEAARAALAAVFDLDALLTEEERSWQRRARHVARDLIDPVVEDDFERARFRHELIPAIAEQGLLGMHIEGYGCAGASATSYGAACLELESADSGWRTFVSVQGSLAMTAIATWGSEQQKTEWLPRMATGEVIGCFGLTEAEGGSDPASMSTRAVRDGGDWILTGTKRWIGLASIAGVAVIWARTDDGVRGFLVPATAPGFTAVPITGKRALRTSIQCDVVLDGVRVPDEARLPGARGLSGPFACLNEARFGIVWGAMGAARSCLEHALARSMSREVFGGPIGRFQLTQQKLADMLLEYEKGVLLALHLGRLHDEHRLPLPQISVGKLNSVREAIRIAGAARSVLGGDGVTDEFPVMRHLANLEAVRTYEGTDEVHTLVLGRALTGLAAFG